MDAMIHIPWLPSLASPATMPFGTTAWSSWPRGFTSFAGIREAANACAAVKSHGMTSSAGKVPCPKREYIRRSALGEVSAPEKIRGIIFTSQLLPHHDQEESGGGGNDPRRLGLSYSNLQKVRIHDDPDGASAQWQRGVVHGQQKAFRKALAADLRKVAGLRTDIRIADLVPIFMDVFTRPGEDVIDCLQCLRAEGIITAFVKEVGFMNAEGDVPQLPFDEKLFSVVSLAVNWNLVTSLVCLFSPSLQ